MGLFARITGKVQDSAQPPAGVEDFVSFTDGPGSRGTDAAYVKPGRVPEYDDGYFPTIAEEDSILIHWYRPPGDENPQEWYQDKNLWAIESDKYTEPVSQPWHINDQKSHQPADHPNWIPPDTNRATSNLSPSSYRFTRAYDQLTEHELNGIHFSMADNRRAYVLGGMKANPNWNNSYRIDPPTNDTQAFFVGDAAIPTSAAVEMTYQRDVWPGANYRLGG